MSWDIILDLLAKGESENLVFLNSLESEATIAREMTALANTSGGKIVIGIDPHNGHLTGARLNRDAILAIARDACSPSLRVTIVEAVRHDKEILLIDVPDGEDKPYAASDGCYIREGNQTRIAEQCEEKKIKGYDGDKKINTRQKKALLYVQEHRLITNREYRELFGISHKTAHLELSDMVVQSLLSVSGSGRSTSYILFAEAELTPHQESFNGMEGREEPLSDNMAELFNAKVDEIEDVEGL